MVLPFISLAGDNESDDWHGLADEVTTNLSRVSALRVIARSAAERVSAQPAAMSEWHVSSALTMR